MKKKRIKIWLLILLLLLIVIGILAYTQRDNLKAFRAGMQYTPAELEEQMEENRQSIQSAVEAIPDITVRQPTADEREALREGTLSEEELVDRLIEKDSQEPEQEPQPNSEYETQFSELIAKAYVLREQYHSILDGMMKEAREEYSAMPDSERIKSKLVKWASSYIGRATDLEKQCDAQIDAIARELAEIIRANNGDLNLVDQLLYNYANEKSLKKSWYLSQLEERDLLS